MNPDNFRPGSWWHQDAREAEQMRVKFAGVGTDPLPLPDRTCPCGRTFGKPFGMRVHQRTCPVANPTELAQAAAERAGLSAAEATVKR